MSGNSINRKSPGGGSEPLDTDRSSSPNASPRSGGSQDVALVCGVSEDGQSLDIIRKRGERIETGTVRRLEQGKPIHGEVVRLRPRENSPLVCDVEVELPAAQSALPATSGPAQVATETYRKNWDAVYGNTRKQRSVMN